ncbi:NAD(P)/FAD-dependent oxidoreductase [Sphingomonas sp. CFBP 13733]|uniref:NAD(P)/FAD-dependent oxidoreductase n=1 Tax=Sphingomonas sp. CFBP 13733 TaxID=2775291 RepID=UPI0017821A60|nr:NAD(P)/FAD-dependent oxidoreductase [Sphingomonas sp. CFBP 13733]MBD8641595.1 NAD(P)/FAD-dependent oxidoreductase [Sphingomonas sp. CFBP 13733]
MQHDAIVIGGSFAGLSAAIHIARARRSVCVIDAGLPRNRFSDASHGFFGQDGGEPLAMIAEASAQLQRYPTVLTMSGAAVGASAIPGGFEVELAHGVTITAAKLVLAFGISDVLPEISGLTERWGKSALHCPYCHGFEYAGQRLGVLQTMPMSAHQALLIADWGPTTLYLNGGDLPDIETQAKLARRGVLIEPAQIARLQGWEDHLSSLLLDDGREVAIDALYLAPRTTLNSPIAEQLGCDLDDGPLGPVIRTDAAKLTSVPGVYAAGDAARVPHNATWAAADGVTAGVSLHQALVFEPLAA